MLLKNIYIKRSTPFLLSKYLPLAVPLDPVGFHCKSLFTLNLKRYSPFIGSSSIRSKSRNAKTQVSIDPQTAKCDCVGPPHNIANIRKYKYYKPENETSIETLYRQKKEETNEWNIIFWSDHNSKFKKEKAEFIQNKLLEKYGNKNEAAESRYISAEEMSVFYKYYLDKNLKAHIDYNNEWYRRNFQNLFLAGQVALLKFKRKLTSNLP